MSKHELTGLTRCLYLERIGGVYVRFRVMPIRNELPKYLNLLFKRIENIPEDSFLIFHLKECKMKLELSSIKTGIKRHSKIDKS